MTIDKASATAVATGQIRLESEFQAYHYIICDAD